MASRKLYREIAEVIKGTVEEGERQFNETRGWGIEEGARSICENLATVLKLDNPKFDRDKFIRACGF